MIDNITLDNLHIGCKASNKAEVIAMIGAELKPKAMSIRNVSTFCWSVNIRSRPFRQWHHPAAFAEIRDGYHP